MITFWFVGRGKTSCDGTWRICLTRRAVMWEQKMIPLDQEEERPE